MAKVLSTLFIDVIVHLEFQAFFVQNSIESKPFVCLTLFYLYVITVFHVLKILRKQGESLSSTGDNSMFAIHTDVIKCTAFPDKSELPKTRLIFITNRIY